MTQRKSPPNHLIRESSPYLLQHAHNPVDWYPWGPEALEKAYREKKPIFLSIGYSACHWCHVMERESFEDESTAKILNEFFVNIKVDREERPDLDHIYMSAVQIMTQHGGWPMSVFLTPNLEPFYGGTYFPPEDRHGLPSFKKILMGVSNAWTTKRNEISQSAEQLTAAIKQLNVPDPQTAHPELTADLLDSASRTVIAALDPDDGGFGRAPKFFHTMSLRLLLRDWMRNENADSLSAVNLTLTKLANGGIYDQLGGGFHRYSTDKEWLVPHFEKMLYDNALLVETYLEAYQATHEIEYARVARESMDYILREMTSPDGGFFSTQDADSENEEGKYYVWTKEEIARLLDKDVAEVFFKVYDVTTRGNWEGKNILRRPNSIEFWGEKLEVEKAWVEDTCAAAARKLLEARKLRVAPHKDEKILCSWNGLMIHSMAFGGRVLADERYLNAAKRGADFIWSKMRENDRLLHSSRDGVAKGDGFLDDYAALGVALLSLFESTFDPTYLSRAEELADWMLRRFWSGEESVFYFTATDQTDGDQLLTRPQEHHDGAIPSATSLAITFLVKLGRITSQPKYLSVAEKALHSLSKSLHSLPTATGQALIAYEQLRGNAKGIRQEIVLVKGKSEDEWENVIREVHSRFLPNAVFVAKVGKETPPQLSLAFKGREAVDEKTTLYLCENFTCRLPFVGENNIVEQLKRI